MSVYLVTWNINKARSNYTERRDKFLVGFNNLDWIRESNLDTVAFLNTTSNATEIYNHLLKNLDGNDRLFVTEIVQDRMGLLNKEVADWLKNRL